MGVWVCFPHILHPMEIAGAELYQQESIGLHKLAGAKMYPSANLETYFVLESRQVVSSVEDRMSYTGNH